jgi:CRP/FNR family transcriptional regulator
VLALNCLFNDLVYPAWVASETDTLVAVIPGPVYRKLFAYEAVIQDLTVRTLSTLVFRLMDELGNVHELSHRQRLANLLLTRASPAGELRMTQQQLADHLGTRREVVARQLLEFMDNGWIETGRGKIQLVNSERLRDIALP